MQVFKESVLRDALRRSEASAQFLTRRDHHVKVSGHVTVKKLGVASRLKDITASDVKGKLEAKMAASEAA